MKLRPYQQHAVSALHDSLKRGASPVVQLPTGTGKSLVLAETVRRLRAAKRRTWVVTHVQELVAQNAVAYERLTMQRPSVYCAGLSRRESGDVIYGSVQSMIGAALRDELPAPDVILVDEAHRVPHRGSDAQLYKNLFTRFPAARRGGCTATPWRLDDGRIYGTDPEDFWFDTLAYRYTVPEAVTDGWLCPLVGVETAVQLNIEGVAVQGDYVQSEVNDREDEAWLKAACASIALLAEKRRHIAVYSPGVTAAIRTAAALSQALGGARVETLTGSLNSADRAAVLERFTSGRTRALVSVDVLTTGFDFPALDCVAVLRPTVSSGLWVQIAGRGTRLASGKKNCLLLDYVGNLQRLGGVDMLDTYYREKDGRVTEERPATPKPRVVKPETPGVRGLLPIDPMTGKDITASSLVRVQVHKSTAVALHRKAREGQQFLLISHNTTTPEGARILATQVLYPEQPGHRDTQAKLLARGIRAAMPVEAQQLAWQAKHWRNPTELIIRRQGRFWNVVEEHYNNEETVA